MVPNDPQDREAHRGGPGGAVGLASINRGSAPPYESARRGNVAIRRERGHPFEPGEHDLAVITANTTAPGQA